jgi:hypothetical protein
MRTGTKKIKGAAAAVLIASLLTFAQPKQAHAVIGLSNGPVAYSLAGAGLLMVATCMNGALQRNDFDAAYQLGEDKYDNTQGDLMFGGSIMLALFGIVLLDDNKAFSPKYQVLNEKMAAEAGLTSNELQSYNSELPLVNAIYQTVTAETKRFNETARNLGQAAEFARTRWTKYAANLSPNTAAAWFKLTDKMDAKLAQAHQSKKSL